MDQQIAGFVSRAVVAGAAAIWKSLFESAGKDAYNKLKSLLSCDPGIIENISRLEKQPDRNSYQLSVQEDIERLNLQDDSDILDGRRP